MARIKEIPDYERPREKAKRLGIQTLSNAELLALIIGSGYVGTNAIDVANNLLSDSGGLFYLFQKNYYDLIKTKGIGTSRALKLNAAIELVKRYKSIETYSEKIPLNSELIFKRYQPQLVGLSQEVLIVVALNRKQQIVFEETLFKGTGHSVDISVKDILRCIIVHNAYQFYLIHNHPGGTLTPSYEDAYITKMINDECSKLGLKLIDHIIISNSGYYSFSENQTPKIEEEEI